MLPGIQGLHPMIGASDAVGHTFNWIPQESVSDWVLNSNSAGWENFTLRQAISEGQIDESGNYVRLSFKGGSTEALTINKAFIGIRSGTSGADFAAAPKPILFSGVANVTIPANTTTMSDPVALVIGPSDGLVVSFFVPVGSSAADSLLMRDVSGLGSTYVSIFKAGDDTTTLTASGYTNLVPVRLALDDLEIST